LKAIDIINFINEDKFAKYNLSQVYDELGHDDFDDYLKDICTNTIKKLDTDTNIKHAKAISGYDTRSWAYAAKTGNLEEHLEVKCHSGVRIAYYVNRNYPTNFSCGISFHEVGYIVTLRKVLNNLYNSKEYKELREKYSK
jgi:hypothetical protein